VLSATASVYLASLPVLHRVQMGNAAWVLCHAVPSDPLFEYVPPHSRSRWVREWEEIGRPQVLAVGHTHLPFVHHVGSGVVLNPGSVGQPKDGDPRAAYAVWNDGVVELKRAAYDIDAVARDLTDRFPPHVALPLAGVLHTGGQLPEAGTE
jgi:diadenosine tetraphosphatase ApaH/serine/threonine PP2A family protein phosphatase